MYLNQKFFDTNEAELLASDTAFADLYVTYQSMQFDA
jgi:hypothetical protein